MSPRPEHSQHFVLIGCEVLFREVCHLSAACRNMVDHVWLCQGLHDLGPDKMSARLQEEIDAVDEGACDAILLAFGLCNNGILGLTARHTPLVIPRAHDCITLFLGSRQRYREHFDAQPGTFYLTSGWLERDENAVLEERGTAIPDQLGLGASMEQLRAQYGEENAQYIMETLGDLTRHYSRIAYIEMDFTRDLGFREKASQTAAGKGWEFELLQGDLGLLQRLLDGEWDEDFLVVAPGCAVAASYDEQILASSPPDRAD